MTKKEQYLRSYINEQKEKSKQYIVVSTAVLLLIGLGNEFLKNEGFIGIYAYNVMSFVIFTLFVSLSVYWYLAIKPSKFIDNKVEHYLPASMTRLEKLTRIDEIFDAISLYEKYSVSVNESYDLSEIENFIAKRRDVFPQNHEFELRSDFKLDLSSEINRNLFITAIKSLKKQLKDEETKLAKLESSDSSIKQIIDNNDDIISLTKTFTNRLKGEIEQLTKAAIIYITFGSAITVGAAVILYFTISDLSTYFSASTALPMDPNIQPEPQTDLSAADWFSVISRFSIVVFVEVFAFFYLRLYRSNMDTVKYYHNEITNIEMRLMAIHSLNTLSNPDSTSANTFIESLAKSERNFVINKGQTTVDLERQKLDSSQITSMFDGITKFTKVAKQ
ncbi:hypothetical protein [Vibrio pomeroyi]|uniref:hypothetical protein n=1 Tax=Vibrio pomeroyi TaxID=198832 RepID=UPI0035A68504